MNMKYSVKNKYETVSCLKRLLNNLPKLSYSNTFNHVVFNLYNF